MSKVQKDMEGQGVEEIPTGDVSTQVVEGDAQAAGQAQAVMEAKAETIAAPGMGIYAAMSNILKDMPAVAKGSVCQMGNGGYKYRGIDDICNAVNPLLAANGVFVVPRVTRRESDVVGRLLHVYCTVVYRFCHRDGSFIECEVMGEGMDSSDKAIGKAMSYAFKYCLMQTFCIPTADVDPDAERVEVDWNNSRYAPAKMKAAAPARQAQANTQAQASRSYRQDRFADSPARDAIRKTIGRRFGGNPSDWAEDVSSFFGRKVLCIGDLSEEECVDWLNAFESRIAEADSF